MDALNVVPNVENELRDSPSLYRLENQNEMPIEYIKQEIVCLVSSEINIKTEIQENETKLSAIAGTSYEIYSNNNVESEFDNLENAITEDPLDVSGLIKDGGIEEHTLSEYVDETKFDIREIEEMYQLKGDTEHKFPGTGKSNNKKHTCHVCHKTITTNLKIHLRTHTGERPFVCNICNKAFSVKPTLYRHMLSHSGERPYACNICEKEVRDRSALDKHMLVHMDVKPFSCNECDKSFKRKQALLDHLQTHTGDRPYICDICEKSFRQQPALIRHRQLHTGEKPFICDVCNKTFARKSNFYRHEESHKRKLQKWSHLHGIFQ